MAYQQQGMSGPQGGAGEHHPQGTEYTLQGVMRFLQLEWHNHERARNSWDIERAEMKAKIAKQEGEVRYSKKLNDQLLRQIKMLEDALRNERRKGQNGAARAATPDNKSSEGVAQKETKAQKLKSEAQTENGGQTKRANATDPCLMVEEMLTGQVATNLAHNSFLDVQPSLEVTEKEREQFIDNTTKYLKSCMKEVQYLLTPPQNPPPPHMLSNGNYTGLPEAPLSIEDIYASAAARRQSQRQSMSAQVLPQQVLPNHHQPPVPNSLPQTSGSENLGGVRGVRYTDFAENSQPPNEPLPQQPAQNIPAPYEEQAETVTHNFDPRMRDADSNQLTRQSKPAETDGWNFDDEGPAPHEQAPEVPPRRPDTDLFPSAATSHLSTTKSPPRHGSLSHRRKSSGTQGMTRRRSSQGKTEGHVGSDVGSANDPLQFKVKFALRGHLDVVRSVIFSGGGSPSEPEVCTTGDDGTIKRWIVPASYQNFNATNNSPDLDITPYFTHRGHDGVVTCLAAPPPSTGFSIGGRANGDGWVFSGGQDTTIRVWERGRVDPKATIEGHTDCVWTVCVLPASSGVVFGNHSGNFGGPDRLLLVSGSADGTVKVWAVSAPPQQQQAPAVGSRRGVGGSRRHSVTTGSEFPKSPQPSVASTTTFAHTLVHSIDRPNSGGVKASPTSICPLSPTGETFVVAYSDSSVLIFDTRSGEEVIGMASTETYDHTMNTSINTVVATSTGMEGSGHMPDPTRNVEEDVGAGATGSRDGVEGVVISGHEDRYVRFYDANSGQCTYTMLAHPAALSCLCLSKDGREAVSAGHDASIRFWSLEKRICTQDINSHRAMRGEGVCCVSWSQDGRLVVSGGGDGVVKVFAR